MSKLSPSEVYVLATIAQHSADPESQNRLLTRLGGKALTVGKIIAKHNVSAAPQDARDLAEGFVKWADNLDGTVANANGPDVVSPPRVRQGARPARNRRATDSNE